MVIDRERLADLGFDLANKCRPGTGHAARWRLREPLPISATGATRSFQIGDKDRATLDPLLDLKIETPGGQLVPVSTFTHIETSTAPRTLNRFQQRNAVRIFGGVKPGVTKKLKRCVCWKRLPRPPPVLARPSIMRANRARSGMRVGPHRDAGIRRGADLSGAGCSVPEFS